MELVGVLRWICRSLVRILRHCHILSQVATCAEVPDAIDAGLGVLAIAYHARFEGTSYGAGVGQPQLSGFLRGTKSDVHRSTVRTIDAAGMKAGAPKDLQLITDSTWSCIDTDTGLNVDVYASALMANSGLVLAELKKAGVHSGSSAELEGLAVLKASDKAVYARIVWAKFGGDTSLPTTLLCDAEAALRAAAGQQAVVRLKHTLRRIMIVYQRVRDGEIDLVHVPDAANVVDMFTKWGEGGESGGVARIPEQQARARHPRGRRPRELVRHDAGQRAGHDAQHPRQGLRHDRRRRAAAHRGLLRGIGQEESHALRHPFPART